MANKANHVAVPVDVYEAVAKYILSKPYAEVRDLVLKLEQNSRPITIKEEEEEVDSVGTDAEGDGDSVGSD